MCPMLKLKHPKIQFYQSNEQKLAVKTELGSGSLCWGNGASAELGRCVKAVD